MKLKFSNWDQTCCISSIISADHYRILQVLQVFQLQPDFEKRPEWLDAEIWDFRFCLTVSSRAKVSLRPAWSRTSLRPTPCRWIKSRCRALGPLENSPKALRCQTLWRRQQLSSRCLQSFCINEGVEERGSWCEENDTECYFCGLLSLWTRAKGKRINFTQVIMGKKLGLMYSSNRFGCLSRSSLSPVSWHHCWFLKTDWGGVKLGFSATITTSRI